MTDLLLNSNKWCYDAWLKALSVRMREPISMQVTVRGNTDIKKKILQTIANLFSRLLTTFLQGKSNLLQILERKLGRNPVILYLFALFLNDSFCTAIHNSCTNLKANLS